MAQQVLHAQEFHAYVWGENFTGRLGLGDAVAKNKKVKNPKKINVGNILWAQIVCGDFHTIALSWNGEVFTWGNGGLGRLGHGDLNNRNVPTKVQNLSKEKIVKVACGKYHSAALSSTGKLFTW